MLTWKTACVGSINSCGNDSPPPPDWSRWVNVTRNEPPEFHHLVRTHLSGLQKDLRAPQVTKGCQPCLAGGKALGIRYLGRSLIQLLPSCATLDSSLNLAELKSPLRAAVRIERAVLSKGLSKVPGTGSVLTLSSLSSLTSLKSEIPWSWCLSGLKNFCTRPH